MGWNVDVEFKNGGVHGTGVFARRKIPVGTKVWQFDMSMNVCTPEEMAALDGETLSFALWGGYLHKPSGLFLWYSDGMDFMNHGGGKAANVGLYYWPRLEDDHVIAFRDIEAGEELREDYGLCLDGGLAPDHWLRPLYLAHCPKHYYFLRSLGELTGLAFEPLSASQEFVRKPRTVSMSAPSSTGLDKTAPNPDAKHAA